ncbi:MAG: benzoate-CoA ligase family protein [Desulfovibrio sp.]|nr:benzoate-CoA ligase family protein [Desulfovibrio sp.]MBI4958448.1 benzoate-CoA ligase family protein [Desulfovibrio sp.]
MDDTGNAACALLNGPGVASPGKPAYVFGESVLTYGHLRERSLRFASYLDSLGILPGERVILVLPDTPAFVVAFLGSLLAGVCPVPVNSFLKTSDYSFVLEDSGARSIFTLEGHAAALAATPDCPAVLCEDQGPPNLDRFSSNFSPRPANRNHPGFMLFSSGSTGRPKGVPHSHKDLLIPSATWGAVLGLTHADVILSSSKLFFAYGLLASLALPLAVGATTVLFPGKPGPYDVFDLMRKHRPTAFFGVPTLYNVMIRAFESDMKDSIPGLCFSAGEALPAVLHEEWARITGVEILDGIGSTEAFNVFISNRRGCLRPGSTGQVVPGYETRLVDDAGKDVAGSSKGHLLIRGESLLQSYWNRPDKTRETILDDGWVRTGDVFTEQDGWFTHQGRSDDMLKSGGQWVSPVQVEEALLRHPTVAECAVAARKMNGLDVICAFVVPAPGTKPDKSVELKWRRYLKETLPEHMCPACFECVAELPKTATGKVQRFVLRES